MQTIEQAQLEMRQKYMYGATGIVVSGFMWLLSGLVAYNYSPRYAILTLFIGGALIHPISTIFDKMLGMNQTHSKDNALGSLAMEGTFFMLMCMPLAYILSLQRTEWFFQGMLIIIGGRYLLFNTIYGSRLYWILGAILGMAGYLLFLFNAQSYISALTGSMIEVPYGLFVYYHASSTKTST